MEHGASPLTVAIIGAGYVGLTTGVCLSEIGHRVLCVENDAEKLALLQQGKSPIYEPELEPMLQANLSRGTLTFGSSIPEAVSQAEIVFICVNTPPKDDGQADLRYVEAVAREIAETLPAAYRAIVDKSTVPVRTAEKVAETIRRYARAGVDFDVVSNPEFLREGTAIADTLQPDRIVVGAGAERARSLMRRVYAPILERSGAHLCEVSIRSAELIKHGANTFLATKISFANLIAEVCEAAGADAREVLHAIGLDQRIGAEFLRHGIGFGGSCFPKDIAAFRHTLGTFGVDEGLVAAVERINEHAITRFIQRIERELWVLDGKAICVLGLSFKPDTDDLRNAPALKVIRELERRGSKVHAYDPKAAAKARPLLPHVIFHPDAYAAAGRSEAIVLCTEWDEFRHLNWPRLRQLVATPIVFDGRNAVDPAAVQEAGFRYIGVGHP